MKKLFCLVFLIAGLIACGYQTGVIQKAEIGYFQFSGNLDGALVKIDNREPFALSTADGNTLFEIKPGKHMLKVFRGNALLIERIVFLESQATFEVKIP
jgi:hypothetical protein